MSKYSEYCVKCINRGSSVKCTNCIQYLIQGEYLPVVPSGYQERGALEVVSNVEHPSHYSEGRKYEPIDVISDWNLGFNLGNAIKYISRAGRKDPSKTKEDLEKAIFYIRDYITRYCGQEESNN